MIDYIVFEKKSENERPPWTVESATEFCREREIEPISVVEELLFIVARILPEQTDTTYRLMEVTETITFILRDDPSLDEFLEADFQRPKIEVEEEKA
jgi:hypothetical protein